MTKYFCTSLLFLLTLGVSSAPSAHASGTFGAICYDKWTKRTGVASGMYSQSAAINKAQKGLSDGAYCRWVRGTCLALYVSGPVTKILWGTSDSRHEANKLAESKCYENGHESCSYIGSVCGND